jgi:hypothetical protein
MPSLRFTTRFEAVLPCSCCPGRLVLEPQGFGRQSAA